ncbi:hypothetical protein AB0I52_22520 [Streptomyces sp. NPDC050423]|uniref:SbtR family transcriptional regulator n=1 Tax=Streptomyces sp. NPDC050423 TaxID=3155402 RepID=UPI003422A02D
MRDAAASRPAGSGRCGPAFVLDHEQGDEQGASDEEHHRGEGTPDAFGQHVLRRVCDADALADAGTDTKTATAEIGASLRHAPQILLARAQETGAVRGDIGVTTLLALLVGASRAPACAGWETPVQAKTLSVVFDGLRPPAGR